MRLIWAPLLAILLEVAFGQKSGKRYGEKTPVQPEVITYPEARWRNHEEWLEQSDYSCIKSVGAFPPPQYKHTFAHTVWAYKEGTPRLYTNYRCRWGYTPEGEEVNLYCRGGKWLGRTKPKCIRVDYTLDPFQRDNPSTTPQTHSDWLAYADYSCMAKQGIMESPDVLNGNKVVRQVVIRGRPHMYIEYMCNEGFRLSSAKRFLYCKQRSWLGEVPTCSRVRKGSVTGEKKSDPCEGNGGCSQNCTVKDDKAMCSCKQGYRLSPDGKSCFEVNECRRPSGKGYQDCVPRGFRCRALRKPGQYKCICPKRKMINEKGLCVRNPNHPRNRKRTGKGKGKANRPRGKGKGRGKGRRRGRGQKKPQ